ncbi:MAG: ACP S-malonyltransferase [Planctomycetes bacterium]|nr:ACP S-malonyltransferase [Planctomycetota bacterium]
MSAPTAVLLCPGRGAYGRDELGFLARHQVDGPVAEALRECDARRAEAGGAESTLTAIDRAERFRPGLHLQGVNAAELIYFGSMLHLEHLRCRYRIVAVAGNSLGWYTALAASGALDPTEGWRLVHTMAELQLLVEGGQVLTTLVGEDWFPDAAAHAEVEAAMAAARDAGDDAFVAPSIRLGGHLVLGGTKQGIALLLQRLPKRRVGDREFPLQLAGNGPFHTELCQATSRAAVDRLAGLRIRRPTTHLVDGLGRVHSPWSADPRRLLDYTLTTQVLEPFDFTAAVRTAIREFNPDVLLCAGPGTSLRAPVGHVVLAEGYRGLHDKQALFASGLVAID